MSYFFFTVTPPPTTPPPPGRCLNTNATAHGAFCYLAQPADRKSWPEANYMCQRLGMDMLSLHSQDELAFVQRLVTEALPNGERKVWLGLQRDLQGKRKIKLVKTYKNVLP